MDWYHDENFWRLTYPLMFSEERILRAEEEIEDILQLCSFDAESVPDPDSMSILDLCCGPGRYSIPLSRRGSSVTGLDSSRFLLSIARERSRIEGLDVEWVRRDMREIGYSGDFDLVMNMYTSFGYFHEHGDNLSVLRDCQRALKPGGRMLLETMGKEVLASIFLPVTCSEGEDGLVLFQRHSIEDDWSRIANDWILIRGETILGRWKFSHWIYSADQVRSMLLQAGFHIVHIYGDLKGGCYGPDSHVLVAVAEKGK